ncbi:hypothetical protein ACS0TY_024781 [Phlomoides rotata]
MICGFQTRKIDMGIGRELCLLLLLIFLLLENPCFADGSSRLTSGKKGSVSTSSHNKGSAEEGKNGNEVFGGEKRRVYTGPNPLHNR